MKNDTVLSSTQRLNICKKPWIFIFARNMGKNLNKILSSKYSQKFLDHAKQSDTAALKTASKRAIQKTAEATSDLIGNKIADKITRVPKLHHITIQKQMKKRYLANKIYINLISIY